jgi:hypothetical protein
VQAGTLRALLRRAAIIGPALKGLKQGSRWSIGKCGRLEVIAQVFLERVMGLHVMDLAAFLVEAHPQAFFAGTDP